MDMLAFPSCVDQHLIAGADDDVSHDPVHENHAARLVRGLDAFLTGCGVHDDDLAGLVREADHLGPGGGVDEDFLRTAESPNVDLFPSLGGVDQNLLPAGACLVAGLDVDFLLVLPGLPPHELPAQVGDLDPGALLLDIGVDIKLVPLLGVLGSTPTGVAGLHIPLHAAVHMENLSRPVDDFEEFLLVTIIDHDGVTGFGLQQHLPTRAVVRGVVVVFAVFQVVAPVRLVLDLVLAVLTGRVRTQSLAFFGLLAGVALGKPHPGPDRVLNVAAFELGPHRRALLGDEKDTDVLVAAVRETGPRPVGPVVPAFTEHRRYFQTAAAEPFRIVVVADKGPVLAVPPVLVAFLVLSVLSLDHVTVSELFPRQDTAQHLADDGSHGPCSLFLGIDLGHGLMQGILGGCAELGFLPGDTGLDFLRSESLDDADHGIESGGLGASPRREFDDGEQGHDQGRQELLVIEHECQNLFKLLHVLLLQSVSVLSPTPRTGRRAAPNGRGRHGRPRGRIPAPDRPRSRRYGKPGPVRQAHRSPPRSDRR
ncbi:hypothetical protein DESC_510034 [Desulfosarcina cetonica]|nr:hypothetical protein DESC_510034 [Desulfosarcina cetonica]